MSKIDPALQMFIQTCCASCRKTTCEGALNISQRLICQKYKVWQNLTGEKRSKLFLAAMAGELITLDDLTKKTRGV